MPAQVKRSETPASPGRPRMKKRPPGRRPSPSAWPVASRSTTGVSYSTPVALAMGSTRIPDLTVSCKPGRPMYAVFLQYCEPSGSLRYVFFVLSYVLLSVGFWFYLFLSVFLVFKI
jgi:hypothetical protein